MTFGTKKGHFNAHEIAPVSNSDLFFFPPLPASRMITPSQGAGPLTAP